MEMPRGFAARSPELQYPFLFLFLFTVLLFSCSPPARDTVPDTRDVRGVADAAPPPKDGYVYVARRPHGAVGLVGAHFVNDEEAHRIVDRIADDLETCARRLEQRGDLVEGALQLVAVTGPRGNADVTDIRFAPGGPVAANALECIVAPLRVSAFPAQTDAGLPAVAIDATWGPNRPQTPDAGGPL
jgi:hypothetical protein